MDHAPGPIIAKAADNIACVTGIHGSPDCKGSREKAIHTFTIAASAPATGVKKPTRRTAPDAAPVTSRMTINGGVPSRKPLIPKWISEAPVSKRRSTRPTPGQPSANVEKSRCTTSRLESRASVTESIDLKLGSHAPPFGGSNADESAF